MLRTRLSCAIKLCGLLAGVFFASIAAEAAEENMPIGLGRSPSASEITALDIAIGPGGQELPPGSGTGDQGAAVYAQRCAACHGPTGKEGPDPPLAGGDGSLATAKPLLTIGSFWPYATTVFDYVRRAMPFNAPGSLSDDEVYALTAYLLQLNGIIGGKEVIDARILPAIRMPNRDGFRPDPRPDVRPNRVLR
jgi:cytochrome c